VETVILYNRVFIYVSITPIAIRLTTRGGLANSLVVADNATIAVTMSTDFHNRSNTTRVPVSVCNHDLSADRGGEDMCRRVSSYTGTDDCNHHTPRGLVNTEVYTAALFSFLIFSLLPYFCLFIWSYSCHWM